jgi:ATP-binding cassette, subfamily C (CFTR/MRP), member 5
LQGALVGKTRLLVTHQLQYVKDCDRIVVMQGGTIAHQGTFEQLLAAGVDLAGFVTTAEDEATPVIPTLHPLPTQSSLSVKAPTELKMADAAPHTPIVKRRSAQSRADLITAGKLMTREFRVEGSVKKNTLSTYLEVRPVWGERVASLRL